MTQRRFLWMAGGAGAIASLIMILLPAGADEGHGHRASPAIETASPERMAPASMDPTHGTQDHHGSHDLLEIPAGQPVPTVAIAVHPDPVSGWNLEIQTSHFEFAPEQVNQADQPGKGHAHLYINGEKISRIYGPWLHLPRLPVGENRITVALNSNDHRPLAHSGVPIEATTVVVVP